MVSQFKFEEESFTPFFSKEKRSNFLADAETLSTVLYNLETVGITDYRVKINDFNIIESILEGYGFDEEDYSQIFFIFGLMSTLGRVGVIKEIKQRNFSVDASARLVGYILRTKVIQEQNICDELTLTDMVPPEISKETRQSLLNLTASVPEVYREKMCYSPFLTKGISSGTGIVFEISYPD